MARFKKRPLVIEAWQFHGHGALPHAPLWVRTAVHHVAREPREGEVIPFPNPIDVQDLLAIGTLEGRMIAGPGDWIIKGIKGELYPCKADIFHATYEPA